jgi:hypothetical protein
MMKRILGTLVATVALTAHAAVVEGTGEYRFGPETAENIACAIAEQRAKENVIANFMGEVIEHSTNEICKDTHCTMYRSMFSETTGQIKRVLDRNSIVAPDNRASVCIVDLKAEVTRLDNPIRFTIKANHKFKHGDKFSISAVSNRMGHYAIVNLIDDTYNVIHAGTIAKMNSEIAIPESGRFEASLLPGQVQSQELLIVLFTEKQLTYKQRYSKIEFESMVKELSFTTRKLVNHSIQIVR